MIRNYLKITLRNLSKRKAYSLINLSGLAIGMACCILIMLYVTDELSYDKFHAKGDRIHRLTAISSIGDTSRRYATVPPALSTGLAESIPEIENAVRLFDTFELQGKIEGESANIPDVWWVDPSFFEVFSHTFLAGDPESALREPDSLVITRETALRLFGDAPALGETITMPRDRALRITGVIRDVPRNSHFQFNGLIPSSFLRDEEGRPAPILAAPYFCQVYAYLLLREGADLETLPDKIGGAVETQWGDLYRQRGTTRSYPLQRLHDIHLRSTVEYEIGQPGDIRNVYLFGAIALLVLGIACFNFINLSTARSAGRAREVGMRKVFGSQRRQLIRQFLSESLTLSLISLFLSLLLVAAALPLFNSLAGKTLDTGSLLGTPILLGMLGIVILTGGIAGSFPAFVLSAFHPIAVLRGRLSSGSRNSALRKSLVILQFGISVFMIIGILTMVKQLDFIKNKDLGFNKDHMVVARFFGARRDDDANRRYDSLRQRVLQNPRVLSVTFSINVPGGDLGYDAYLPEGRSQDETVRARNYIVDYDFLSTYGIELVQGRDFSRDFATDAGLAVLINQSMARALGGGEDLLGKRILNVARDMRPGEIVGVIRDFHSSSMHMPISPVIISLDPRYFGFVSVRIRPENVAETLGFLESTLGDVSREAQPERAFNFDYYFIDDDFRRKYPAEDRAREIYLSFGVLAVFIACLGLFGLASFTLEQRTKEIGVRKVLGASSRNIVLLLTRQFSFPILAAILLAWPLAYYAMHRWLAQFAYRIRLTGEIFALAGLIGIVIAGLTVCFHSVKAALSDPVRSLRYE